MLGGAVFTRLARGLVDAVFPARCVACGAYGEFLCPACVTSAQRTEPPRCPCCWTAAAGGGECGRCRRERPHFLEARSVFLYGGPVREAVHALKYEGVSAVAGILGAEMVECLNRWGPPSIDALVPVPLTGARRRLRGFNQAGLLADEISRRAGMPVLNGALMRVRHSGPQARSDEVSRRANVEAAFSGKRELVSGLSLLLADDVMTSGATANACALALREAGAAEVRVLTLARED